MYYPNSNDTKSEMGALIQYLELFNHSPEGQVLKKGCYLETVKEVKKGEQIFVDYGEYDAGEMLLVYGFVVDISAEEEE